jgi:LVIVD repeat-containing protein
MYSPRRMLSFSASLIVLGTASALRAQTYPTGNDPRNGLKPGMYDAGDAAQGLRLVSFSRKPAEFDSARGLAFINSDLAFKDHYVYQGNFAGFTIWDVANPAQPKMVAVVPCITSQGDPSIVGNLLFVSAEGGGNRNDCAKGGVQNPSEHMAGVRIYDVSNPAAPRLVKNVQTCKGSHTHTVIPDPKNKDVVFIYVSGSQGARPADELAGCNNGTDPADVNNSLFRLDVIKVPLENPEQADVVTGARIFTGLEPAPTSAMRREAMAERATRGGRNGRGGAPSATPAGAPVSSSAATPAASAPQADPRIPTGPRNCHDVTAYPSMHLLAGACASYGLLVDISNPEKPVRLDAKADTNFSLWHTAVFSNDGSKVVFTDEWGGGTQPMCQATSMMEMGGDAILTISKDKKFTEHSYFKIPSAQTAQENCVSHNGGLIPVPGRDLFVQGWYQGGVDVSDFTDPDHPFEVAFFDRGPVDAPPAPGDTASAAGGRMRGTIGGSWGAYYWNGYIYSSELARGFDILELVPSDKLSANEIAAAKLVTMSEYNPQSQPHYTFPAAFPVVRSYLDQLVRNNGLSNDRTSAIDRALTTAEGQSGAKRAATLSKLAAEVDKDVKGAKDSARVKTMASEIRRLAAASK